MGTSSTISLRTGSIMPIIGLGTWQLTRDTAETVACALDLGYRLIDTSSDYHTQPGIGRALAESGIARQEIFLTTKAEETDDAYIRTLSNLRELGVDYVDLMLIHRPPPAGAGEHLWAGLIRARDEGLTRDIGVSNYDTAMIDRLVEDSGEVPVVNQIEWSPFGHSDQMSRYCRDHGIAIQAYSPLTRATRLGDETLNEVARRHGRTPAQVLIRWNLQQGFVPIPKANRPEHLEENLDVFDFELGAEEIEDLNSLNEGYSALGHLPYLRE